MAATHHMSRRGFCLCCAAAATAGVGAMLTPAEAYAQARAIVLFIKSDAATAEIAATRLRGGVTMLSGSGGNIAVLPGKDGTVMIDAGIGVSKPRLVSALQSIEGSPASLLVNTHWHFDHADGNAWIAEAGATVVAHDNTRARLASTQFVEDWKTNFPAPPSRAVPTETFANEKSIRANDETLELAYYGPAHTDGDVSVRFAKADVLHVGDTLWNGFYPFIDYSTGGSIDGTIQAAEQNLKLVGPRTIVIPGHGPIADRTHLVAFREMLVRVRDNVASLKRQGRSLEETIAAKPTAAFDAGWDTFVIDAAFFTSLVYKGV